MHVHKHVHKHANTLCFSADLTHMCLPAIAITGMSLTCQCMPASHSDDVDRKHHTIRLGRCRQHPLHQPLQVLLHHCDPFRVSSVEFWVVHVHSVPCEYEVVCSMPYAGELPLAHASSSPALTPRYCLMSMCMTVCYDEGCACVASLRLEGCHVELC